jgi:phosphoglycerate dehydrogenase-like enzyme
MGEMNSGKILDLHRQIRDVLTQARARAWRAVNSEMVACYSGRSGG